MDFSLELRPTDVLLVVTAHGTCVQFMFCIDRVFRVQNCKRINLCYQGVHVLPFIFNQLNNFINVGEQMVILILLQLWGCVTCIARVKHCKTSRCLPEWRYVMNINFPELVLSFLIFKFSIM